MNRLTNEQLAAPMTQGEFQQWFFNRIAMRMAQTNIHPDAKISLGDWIYGIEQSGILTDLELTDDEVSGPELTSIMNAITAPGGMDDPSGPMEQG